MTPLSILELVRVTEETDARSAINKARDLAAHAEQWGYNRIWVAEHGIVLSAFAKLPKTISSMKRAAIH